jgi:hypothetical protein
MRGQNECVSIAANVVTKLPTTTVFKRNRMGTDFCITRVTQRMSGNRRVYDDKNDEMARLAIEDILL